jgi:hypothetical protein
MMMMMMMMKKAMLPLMTATTFEEMTMEIHERRP